VLEFGYAMATDVRVLLCFIPSSHVNYMNAVMTQSLTFFTTAVIGIYAKRCVFYVLGVRLVCNFIFVVPCIINLFY
jgi:hypothetical protein